MDTNPYSQKPEDEDDSLQHANVYISKKAKKELVALKAVNPDRINNEVRRAIEAVVEKEYRLLKAIGAGR